jgi:hypothetical protein
MKRRAIQRFFSAVAAAVMLSTIITIVDAQERRPRYPNRDPTKQEEDEEEVRNRRATPPPPPPVQLPDKRTKGEFEVRYWFSRPRLSARVSDTIGGTPVNGLAGIDLDSTNMPEPRFVGYITRANKIRVDYLKMSAQGTASDISVQVPGVDTFFGDLDLDSLATAKLDIQQFRVGYAFQGLNINNKVRVGPLVEVRGYKFNASVSSPANVFSGITEEYYAGMVTAGADLKIAPTSWMEIDSVISAIHLGGLGRVIDFDTSAKYFFHKNVAASGGYRFLRLRVEDQSNLGELRIHGPFAGIAFRF